MPQPARSHQPNAEWQHEDAQSSIEISSRMNDIRAIDLRAMESELAADEHHHTPSLQHQADNNINRILVQTHGEQILYQPFSNTQDMPENLHDMEFQPDNTNSFMSSNMANPVLHLLVDSGQQSLATVPEVDEADSSGSGRLSSVNEYDMEMVPNQNSMQPTPPANENSDRSTNSGSDPSSASALDSTALQSHYHTLVSTQTLSSPAVAMTTYANISPTQPWEHLLNLDNQPANPSPYTEFEDSSSMSNGATPTPTVQCQIGGGYECTKEASYFCINCEKLLCEEHVQQDLNFRRMFEEEHHEYVPVAEYLHQSPESSVEDQHNCPIHQGVKIRYACKKCHLLMCQDCTVTMSTSAPPTDPQALCHHDPDTIPLLAGQLANEMREITSQLQQAAATMERYMRNEKMRWRETRQMVQKMRADIHARTNEQIEKLREKEREMLQELLGKANLCKQETESNLDQCGEIRQLQENMKSRIIDMMPMAQRTPRQLVSQFTSVSREVKDALLRKPSWGWSFDAMLNFSDTEFRNLEVELNVLPTKLQLVTSSQSNESLHSLDFRSVYWLDNDTLLLSCSSNLLLCRATDLAILVECKIGKGESIVHAFMVEGMIKCIIREHNSLRFFIEHYLVDQNKIARQRTAKMRKPISLGTTSVLDITPDGEIIELNTNKCLLVMRYGDGGKRKEYSIPECEQPSSFCVFQQERKLLILVADMKQQTITKYEIGHEIRLIWICKNIHDPSAIRVNGENFAFVSSYLRQSIHLISPSGEKLTELFLDTKADELSISHDMAIQNDRVAFASLADGVKIVQMI